jgi:hypothetical protein
MRPLFQCVFKDLYQLLLQIPSVISLSFILHKASTILQGYSSAAKFVHIYLLKSLIIAESTLQRDKNISSNRISLSNLLKHTETPKLVRRLPSTSCLRHFPKVWIREISRRVRASVLDKLSIQSETPAS